MTNFQNQAYPTGIKIFPCITFSQNLLEFSYSETVLDLDSIAFTFTFHRLRKNNYIKQNYISNPAVNLAYKLNDVSLL